MAIVPIVLFHAGFALFSGGFVGVDIFFVISGYLITSIIAREMATGQFNLWRFYERRIRRIFPALVVMVLCASMAAWFLLFPLDLQAYGRSLVASIGFFANISFWLQSGYFDTASDLKPLLHTWSLAVEEQFYLFFPLLLASVMRQQRGYRLLQPKSIVWAVLIASFLLSVFGVSSNPDATFYLIPTRAWELLLGSVLALKAVPPLQGRLMREALAALGLVLILAPVFAYDSQTVFPGLAALWPCLGSALLIWTGEAGAPTRIARLLMMRPVVWIGLVSYSLYLWHWPVMVFTHHWLIEKPDLVTKLLLVVASLVLGFFSYALVERPVRDRAAALPRRQIFQWAGGTGLACLLLGGLFWSDGFISRFPVALQAQLLTHEAQTKGFVGLMRQAHGHAQQGLPIGGFMTGEGVPEIAIWGDSHVGAILNGLNAAAAPDHPPPFTVFALGGCRPIVGLYLSYESSTACHDHNKDVLDYLLKGPERKIVLVSRWPVSVFGDVRASGRGDKHGSIAIVPARAMEEAEALMAFEQALGRTIDALTGAGKQVFVVETIIDMPLDVPHLVFKSLLRVPSITEIRRDISPWHERFTDIEQVFDTMQRQHRFSRIRLRDALCKQWNCLVYQDGKVLYTDNNHLSEAGSAILAPLFRQVYQRPE